MTASVRGSGGGRRIFLPRALVDVFEKNGKKNKTTSVYRLSLMCHMIKLGVKNDNSQKKFIQGRSLSPCARETCLKKKSHARL